MKRTAALPVLVLSALGSGLITACDESSDAVTTPLGAVAIYSPASGEVPLPNDLLFSGSVDGTLNAPSPTDPSQQGLFDAINALDGWSTTAPIAIAFSESIDPASVTGNVRVFEVSTAGLTLGNAVTGITSELTFGVDFVASAAPSGGSIAILPLTPLAPASNYMVVVTNGVLDADGAPAQRSIVYDLASETEPLDPDDPLAALQPLIGAMQAAAAGAGIAADDIIVSFTFQTQSIGSVLGTVTNLVAGAEATVISGLCGALPIDCTDTSADPNLVASVQNFQAVPTVTTFLDTVDVFQGELTLPYFLTAATAGGTLESDLTQDPTPLGTWWNSRFDWIAPGIDDPNHVTGTNSLPATTGQETIPVLVSVPKTPKPVDGWPVVIFQHGIGGNRAALLGFAGLQEVDPGVFAQVLAQTSIADAFAALGFACIAIDLPLHGLDSVIADLFAGYETSADALRERTFGLDLLDNVIGTPNPAGDGFADASGAHFINLTSLRTTRDNNRQAVADLLYLLRELPNIDLDGGGGDFDVSDVHFVGHSLGGIVGGVFLQYANTISTVQTASLGMAGGQLAYLLQGSANFGPVIDAGLGAFGLLPGTPEYDLFFVAAQSLADDADPINYAANLVSLGVGAPTTPIYLAEVVGELPTFLDDQTVPNSVATAPLAGTEPYISTLGLTSIESDTVGGPINGVVRFIRGSHGSFAFPSLTTVPEPELNAANAEMLLQMTEFATSGGTSLTLNDETIIDTGS